MNDQQPQAPDSPVPTEPDNRLDLLTAENERLRSELRLRSARDSLLSAFANENARSPELLFEASAPRFEFDETGSLANTVALVSGLRQRFPEQFETAATRGPEPGPQPDGLRTGVPHEAPMPTPSGAPRELFPSIHAGSGRVHPTPSLTKEALTAMSPQQILALDWDEVRQVLST